MNGQWPENALHNYIMYVGIPYVFSDTKPDKYKICKWYADIASSTGERVGGNNVRSASWGNEHLAKRQHVGVT